MIMMTTFTDSEDDDMVVLGTVVHEIDEMNSGKSGNCSKKSDRSEQSSNRDSINGREKSRSSSCSSSSEKEFN
jgi:hypothetical protein